MDPSRVPAARAALALAALLALTLVPAARAAPLNDTGQITCYNATTSTGTVSPGTAVPADPGFEDQDCTRGAAAADALGLMSKQGASSMPGRDYTRISNAGNDLPASAALGSGANDWACTRDNVTGLTWEVKVDDPFHLRHFDHTYTWYDSNGAINGGNAGSIGSNTCNATLPSSQCNTSAIRDAVNAAGLCGQTDWRLPSDVELQGVDDYGTTAAPFVDAIYFPNTRSDWYWTGVNVAHSASHAWVVFFGNGYPGANFKSASGAVRLVRGGQPLATRFADTRALAQTCPAGNPRVAPDSRYTRVEPVTGQRVVTDTATGLVWKECNEGQTDAGCGGGSINYMIWASAVAAARNSTWAGYDDWRLPNINELHSLVETGCHDPGINTSYFPNSDWDFHWSSTTFRTNASVAWSVRFNYSYLGADSKSNNGAVRLVRGGQWLDSFDADQLFTDGFDGD